MVEGFDPEVERSDRTYATARSRRAERSIRLNPKQIEYFELSLIKVVSWNITYPQTCRRYFGSATRSQNIF